MSVTEPRRHHLYELARERFDEPAAETLLDMLDAIENSQLATKSDMGSLTREVRDLGAALEGFASKTDLERFATRADLSDFGAQFERELRVAQSRYVSWLLASQAVVVTTIGIATAVLLAVLG